MIQHVVGDMLDFSKDTPDIIIHQTNCEGKMGGGVAKVIKEKFPKVYVEYLEFIAHNLFEQRDTIALPIKCSNLLGRFFYSDVPVGDKSVLFVDLFAQDSCSEGTSSFSEKRFTSYDAMHEGLIDIRNMLVFSYHVQKLHGTRPVKIWMPEKIGCVKGGGKYEIVKAIVESVFDNPSFSNMIDLTLFTLPEKNSNLPKGPFDAM